MFIRSKDGKHLTKAKSIDLEGNKILVNGAVFAEYNDEEEAEKAKAYTAEIKCEYKREERKRRCKIISTITGQVRLCPDCISCYGDECPKKHGMVVEEGGPAPFEELAEFVKSSVYTDDPTADEAVVNVM